MARSPRSNSAGTDEVADVLDHDDGARRRPQFRQPARDHVGFEMAAGAGVDLHGRRAGGADALAVVGGRLVALDDEQLQLAAEVADGAFEQRVLPAPGELTRLSARISRPANQARFFAAKRVVLGEDARLQLDDVIGRACS